MRPGLVLLCLLATACGPEICAGIDGACVALTVRGAVEIDGLDITLAGAASGHRVAPGRAEVATLPVHVALQLPDVQPGVLAIRVIAVRLGVIVGGGDISLPISSGEHTTASIDLGETSVDGGLTSSNDLACPAETTRCGPSCCGAKQRCTDQGCVACAGGVNACGEVCCEANQVCLDGACALPFRSASLYVYLCPNFNSGCSSSAFTVGGVCSPLTNAQAGKCYDTGITVGAGMTYALASCQSCPSNCTSPVSLMTPTAGFASDKFYDGISFFCQTPCTAPASCP